ncbi:MAG: hypothetical protein U5K31_01540 [Balneolaceae bacterium]|nr:hypothetical protein [Balneolaceae bacterium]
MKRYWKYLLAAGAVILLAALYLSHFYAAREAERELDRTLRNWVADSNPDAGIQFSGVEIHPFSGTLDIHDLHIFTDRHLQRGALMRFRLGYPMFLRMYFGDPSTVLDRQLSLRAHLENISWLDRYRLREVSFDTLELDYRGNPADLLRNILRDSPLAATQELLARGRGFGWSEPYMDWGSVRADSLRLRRDIPVGSSSLWSAGDLELELNDLTWRMPDRFISTYSFFLRGFDYTGQTMPLQSFHGRMSYAEDSGRLNLRQMRLRSEHVRMELSGEMELREPAGSTSLEGLRLLLSDFSPRFRNVLEGMNRLLRLNLSTGEDSVWVPLGGTLGSPSLPTRQN